MAFKGVSMMILCLLATCAAKQNCSEIQCKLLPVDEDVASEFQAIKSSGNGVRMIYLKLLIGNDSYDPLELEDEFLSDRWVWAAKISELMLSMSYDYDILSWGLLKRQVRHMNVTLRDEPSGCLAGLNSSCQNIVVGQALLGNVTSKDDSGKDYKEDVVCVAEIDSTFNFVENFLDGDVEFRCCKAVKQSKLPRCELDVQRSNWFKAFYVVLNVLTVFVGVYSPALLFMLPDYIFDVRKECEKEEQQQKEEAQRHREEMAEMERQMQQTGYQYLPSSQEVTEERIYEASGSESLLLISMSPPSTTTGAETNEISQEMQSTITEESINAPPDSEWIMLDWSPPATGIAEANNTNTNEPDANEPANTINDLNSNEVKPIEPNQTSEPNSNEATSGEPNHDHEPNPNEATSNEPNSNESNSNESGTTKNDDEEEEKRKLNEIPLDDGSPFNISTLLYTCKASEVLRGYSTKLSFNTKLAFLWFCACPVFFYIELALGYTLKDEYFEEIAKKDTAFLVGGMFLFFQMTDLSSLVVFLISYFVIPLGVMSILRPNDLYDEETDDIFIRRVDANGKHLSLEIIPYKYRVYAGERVIRLFKKFNRDILIKKIIFSLAKVPIHVYKKIQNLCDGDNYIKIGAPRYKRFLWVLLKISFFSVLAVIFSVISAAVCVFLILASTAGFLVLFSPYNIIILYFYRYKIIKQPWLRSCLVLSFFHIVILVGFVVIFLPISNQLKFMLNPFILTISSLTYPFFLAFYSCRFLVKMFGYTIMGLILNAEIAAPAATFVATVTKYMHDCYLNSQNKCKTVKQIISQKWQKGIEDSDEVRRLEENEKPTVTSDTIPKKLFWHVCDSDEYKVLPLENEAILMFGSMAIIFFSAFLALCAIFLANNSYKISAVASTIAVFVSGKIPTLFLPGADNFNGWDKIRTKRKIGEAVGKFIKNKLWLKPQE